MLNLLKSFRQSEDGVAATEFALIAPVLLTILLGTIEFSKYSMINRRAEMTTNMMVEYLSRDPDQEMSNAERNNLSDMTSFTNVNAWRDGERGGELAYSYAAAEFVKADPTCIGVDCEFTPNPLWFAHGRYNYLPDMRSNCNMTIVPNNAPRNGSNIPTGLVGRSAIVRVQTVHRYVPLLENSYIPFFYMKYASIKKTRSGSKIDYPGAQGQC